MRIGVALPATVAGATGADLITWATTVEAKGFSSLAVLDRLVYRNVEPLIALAAAAAVTERVELATTILIGPYRANAALLAKQLASIDLISGGRLVVGLAVGTRADDYEVSHVDFTTRGRQFEVMLDEMDRVWGQAADDPLAAIGPKPPTGRPALLFGGTSPAAFQRAATRGDGWVMGGGGAGQFADGRSQLVRAWNEADRDGEPRTCALAYFALGPQGPDLADAYLADYYGFLGAQTAQAIASGAVTDEGAARARIRDFAAAGCDELVFVPCDRDPEQVDRLADATQTAGDAP